MDTTELLKKVRKIEIKTKGLSRQMFSGEYHSAFKGRGMSFSEVRNYQYGDDVRNIDWNVTARTGIPHVKVFEEERELTVLLLIDLSQSVWFGSLNQFKQEIITEISAVLSFSAIQNNDKVGVIFFTDRIEKFIPPKKGRSHILRIIRELIHYPPLGNGTNISEALTYLNNVVKKRSICFLLSDFLGKDYEVPLRLASQRHDLIGIHVYDLREHILPATGLVQVKNAETGEVLCLDSTSELVRLQYSQAFEQHLTRTKILFQRSGIDFISIRTDENYLMALHAFFKKRMQ